MEIQKEKREIRRLAAYTAVILATIALAILMFQFRSILILLILSILVSAAIRPGVLFLIERLKFSRPAATLTIYLVGVIIFLAFLIIPGNALINEFQTLFNNIAATYEARFPEWKEGSTIERAIAAELPPPDQLYETLAGPIFGQEVLGITRGLFGALGGAAVILVLSIYWTIDQARLERYWLSSLPADWRIQARRIWRAIEVGGGAYLRSEMLQSMAAALLLGAVYWMIGIDFPLILAGVAAVAWLIPLVGAFFAVLPVMAIGFLNDTVGFSAVAALCTIAILSGLELVVEPRLFNRRRYNSTTTVLLMLVFIQDFGLVGLIMAPPITAALQILFNFWIEHAAVSPNKKPASEIVILRKRLDGLMTARATNGDELTPEIINLGKRLSKLLDEAEVLTAKK